MTDIGVLAQKPFVFVVEPFSKKGTLKDLIYKVKAVFACALKCIVSEDSMLSNISDSANVFTVRIFTRYMNLRIL